MWDFSKSLITDNECVEDFFQHPVYLKREDKIHPWVSGNKFRKLRYNLQNVQRKNYHTVLSVGGAHSNHIMALAWACNNLGLKSIAIIRGKYWEHCLEDSPTLCRAKECGMRLIFVSKESYKNRHQSDWALSFLKQKNGVYFLPEGGSNALGILGCQEILKKSDALFQRVLCPVGTGATLAGLIKSAHPKQIILGVSALKANDSIRKNLQNWVGNTNTQWDIITDVENKRYGSVTPDLIDFMNTFFKSTGIVLDPIYTGKMLFTLQKMIRRKKFPQHEKILAIHTGGLQGIEGMNKVLLKKQKTIINPKELSAQTLDLKDH